MTPTQALVFFDAARTALERAVRVDEIKEISDNAEALRLYARQADPGRARGEQEPVVPVAAGGVHPEPRFEKAISETRGRGEELATAGLLRAATRQNVVDVMGSSETYEWYTPSRYVEAARAVMGGIDFDPASSATANRTVGAKGFYDLAQDGLSRAWQGRVCFNPPYGMGKGGESNQILRSKHIIDHYEKGSVTRAVLLVDAATDAGWFRTLWEFPLRFLDEGPRGEGRQPTHGNVFAYLSARGPGPSPNSSHGSGASWSPQTLALRCPCRHTFGGGEPRVSLVVLGSRPLC